MKLRAVAIASAAAVALAGEAHAYPSGTITGGTATSDWTRGQVDDMTATFDLCGSDGSAECRWAALAGVMPAANGSCPHDWYRDRVAAQLTMFWSSGFQTANGTVASGAREFQLNGAHGQRVCLFTEREFVGGEFEGRGSSLIASKLLQEAPPPTTEPTPSPEPPPPPPPPASTSEPQPALTASAARRAARAALSRRFRASWRRGRARSLRCRRSSTRAMTCRARWRYRGEAHRASVRVTRGEDGRVRARVRGASRHTRAASSHARYRYCRPLTEYDERGERYVITVVVRRVGCRFARRHANRMLGAYPGPRGWRCTTYQWYDGECRSRGRWFAYGPGGEPH